MKSTPKPSDTLQLIKMVIEDFAATYHSKFQLEIEADTWISSIKAKDLLYIDPSKPLVVRKEPAYMAGVAGASISAPGPYDKMLILIIM
jgi:hypothetical protein